MNSSNRNSVIIGIVVVVVILALGAWYVFANASVAASLGLAHPPVATSTNMYGMNPGNGMMGSTTPGGRGAGMRGGFTSGTIEVLNDSGFTVTLPDGTTKDINLSATTTIQNYATASSTPTTITADQLSVGEQVSVIGTPNADESIDARMVRTGAVPARTGMRGTGGGGQYGRGVQAIPPASQ